MFWEIIVLNQINDFYHFVHFNNVGSFSIFFASLSFRIPLITFLIDKEPYPYMSESYQISPGSMCPLPPPPLMTSVLILSCVTHLSCASAVALMGKISHARFRIFGPNYVQRAFRWTPRLPFFSKEHLESDLQKSSRACFLLDVEALCAVWMVARLKWMVATWVGEVGMV